MALAEVVIDGIPLADPRPYTYRIPPRLHEIRPGSVVLVPFGNRPSVGGIVTSVSEEDKKDTKDPDASLSLREIQEVLSGELLPPSMNPLLQWVAAYYAASFSGVWLAAIPKGILASWESIAVGADRDLLQRLAESGPASHWASRLLARPVRLAELKKDPQAYRLLREGLHIELRQRERKTSWIAVLQDASVELRPRQQEVLEVLSARGGRLPVPDWLEAAKTTMPVVKALAQSGCVLLERATHNPLRPVPPDAPLPLTSAQATALEALKNEQGVFLLHGVTGSGKTEVYLQAIEKVLAEGRTAIVLVPEISLTPQTQRRFSARFGDQVAILHSALSEGERRDEWLRLRRGEARIAVGARSAIFAPLEKVGLIVIDEEHETSYKQESSPRYHARSVALKRAEIEGASVILGSATPSFESFERAKRGEYTLLSLPERIEGRPLPPVEIVDMREELRAGHRSMLSRSLLHELEATLDRQEQTILLINQRGFSRFVLCRKCGFVVRCPRCSVSLTLHKGQEDRLVCHYCGFQQAVPENCPSCQSAAIRHFGAGTQQLAEVVEKQFPTARVERLDRDTTSRKGAHETLLSAFQRGEIDVLIGTQMVAKGLDFPRVTLVGVIAADLALNLPDFRSAERTFQLLTQVAGRAGRSELPGKVVVQTYAPEHPSILAARDHDFLGFFEGEIDSRKELNYPPFGHLINVVASGTSLEATMDQAEALAKALREEYEGCDILGPVPAPLARLKDRHRIQVLFKIPHSEDLPACREALERAVATVGGRFTIDVDPSNLL